MNGMRLSVFHLLLAWRGLLVTAVLGGQAAGLLQESGLVLLANPEEGNHVIQVSDGPCKAYGKVGSCQELGVSTVFGLKDTDGRSNLLIHQARIILSSRNGCPIGYGIYALLLETLEQESSGEWVEIDTIDINSKYYSWFLAGILRPGRHDTGTSYQPVQLKDVCDAQAWQTASTQQHKLLEAKPSEATQQRQLLQAKPTAGQVVYWGTDNINEQPAPVPSLGATAGVVKDIAAGGFHVLALLTNDSVIAWGRNDLGQLYIPAEVAQQPVAALAAGYKHSLLLLQNTGSVVCLGDNQFGQCNITAEAAVGAIAIRAEESTSFVRLANGSWTAFGELQPKWDESNFGGRTDIVAIHTDITLSNLGLQQYIGILALLQNGTVLQYGNSLPSPPALSTSTAKAVCVGSGHAVVLLPNNSLIAWGYIQYYSAWQIPQNVQGRVQSIACGSVFTVALLTDGSIQAWGDFQASRVQLPANIPVNTTYVGAGNSYTVYLSGNNVMQGGWLSTVSSNPLPDGLDSVTAVSARYHTALALKSDGRVVPWGYLYTQVQNMPQDVTNSIVVKVSAGHSHALALLQTGTVVQWGSIDNAPVPLEALSGVDDIAAGQHFSLAVKQGRVIVWGDTSRQDSYCNLTNNLPPVLSSNVVQVAAGFSHAMFLLQNGSVIVLGCNVFGQTNVPENLANVKAVYANNAYSSALLENGTLIAWGARTEYFNGFFSTVNTSMVAPADDGATLVLANGTLIEVSPTGIGANNIPTLVQNRTLGIAGGLGFRVAIIDPTKPILPPSPPPPAEPPAATGTVQQGAKEVSTGAIVGFAAAGLVACTLAIAAACIWWRTKHEPLAAPDGCLVDEENPTKMDMLASIPGVMKGEVFTRATALEYTWTALKDGDTYTPVSAGVNDNELDLLAVDGQAGPAIQLTRQQIKEQIQLIQDGLVGRGATALVFKCLWPSRFGSRSVLAAKVLKDGYEVDDHTLRSFSYEASVLERLSHPNIVRLYGYCLEQPTVCLILELLPYSLKQIIHKCPVEHPAIAGQPPIVEQSRHTATGDALYKTSSSYNTSGDDCITYITILEPDNHRNVGSVTAGNSSTCPKLKPLTMLQVLQISIDIAAALEYLHEVTVCVEALPVQEVKQKLVSVSEQLPDEEQAVVSCSDGPPSKTMKVVHRDLKPANVLIGMDGRAKLTDFGLARQQMNSTLMTERAGVGTLPYMAPELLVAATVGAGIPATNRVDIYSAAMVMWEMLSGQQPWQHVNPTAIMAVVMSGKRPELPTEKGSGNNSNATPLSKMPASLDALPEFNSIIRACWNPREHRRPTAAVLHGMLTSLLHKCTMNHGESSSPRSFG